MLRDIKPFENLTKGMGLHPREIYSHKNFNTVLGIQTLYIPRIPVLRIILQPDILRHSTPAIMSRIGWYLLHHMYFRNSNNFILMSPMYKMSKKINETYILYLHS